MRSGSALLLAVLVVGLCGAAWGQGDGPALAYVGSALWSGMRAVAAWGDHAFVAMPYGLMVVDLRTPSSPVEACRLPLPGGIRDLFVASPLLLAACGEAGLCIIDIAEPAEPTLVASLQTPGAASGVRMADAYAFVADGAGGLCVVDLSNPSSPSLLASLPTAGQAVDVALADGRAFLAMEEAGIQVVDVSDPSTPVAIFTHDTPGMARALWVTEGRLHVADDYNGLVALSIAPSGQVAPLWTVSTGGPAKDVLVTGNCAFVADETGWLQVIDLRAANPPFPMTSDEARGFSQSLGQAGEQLLTVGEGGLQVWSLADAWRPSSLGQLATPGPLVDVALTDGHAFVSSLTAALHVLEIGAHDPIVRATISSRGPAHAVAATATVAYLAADVAGLEAVEIADPVRPRSLGVWNSPGRARGVFVAGDRAYVADGPAGLQVVDVSNPDRPLAAGAFDTPGFARAVRVSDGFAFVADSEAGLQVIDVSDPTAPALAGVLDTPGSALGLALRDEFAYLADGDAGLAVVDVADPARPSEIGRCTVPGRALDVAVAGTYLYVAAAEAGLQVIDASDPGQPIVVASYDTPGSARRVALSGSRVCVADESGLLLLRAATTLAFAGQPVDTVSVRPWPLRIVAAAPGESPAAVCRYRLGGRSAYASAEMQRGLGDTLVFEVPPSLLTARGLEFYFEVDFSGVGATLGDPASPFVLIVEVDNAAGQRPAALPDASYRIIGLPLQLLDDASPTAVFADDLGPQTAQSWRLFSYDPVDNLYVEYPAAAAVSPGRGYWLAARGAQRYGAAGRSMRPSRNINGLGYFEVELAQGWNLLANPFPFDIQWSDVRFEDNGLLVQGHPSDVVRDIAYWYSGVEYVPNGVLLIPAWEGFFLQCLKPGVKILFPYLDRVGKLSPVASGTTHDPVASGPVWGWRFTLEASGLRDSGNEALVLAGAAAGPDECDFPEPPPAPEGPRLGFRLDDAGPGLLRVDARPPGAEGFEWALVLSPGLDRQLRAERLGNLPANWSAWLEFDDGMLLPLPGSRLEFRVPQSATAARLVVGSADYLGDRGAFRRPQAVVLHANVPNPFNPSTRIEFEMPASGRARLDVFDIRGALVRTLVDGYLPEGIHAAAWDGRDDSARPVGSGRYLYRLQTANTVLTRSMILVR